MAERGPKVSVGPAAPVFREKEDDSIFLRNVSTFLPDFMVSHPRRQ
jgi:hypothetical protein